MISDRCTRENLLNHLNQLNIEYEVNYEQIMDQKDQHWTQWKGSLIFNNKIYGDYSKTKKNVLQSLVDMAQNDILQFINQLNN